MKVTIEADIVATNFSGERLVVPVDFVCRVIERHMKSAQPSGCHNTATYIGFENVEVSADVAQEEKCQ